MQMTSTLNGIPGGSFSYDANDRIGGDTFDANGNTTSSAGISSTYDFENRMLTRGAVTIILSTTAMGTEYRKRRAEVRSRTLWRRSSQLAKRKEWLKW